MKRLLAIVLALCMLFGLLPVSALAAEEAAPAEVQADAYDDVDGHWAEEAIYRWSEYGILEGYDDGLFRPEDAITRGEVAKIISVLMGYVTEAENRFSDLPDKWYLSYVLQAVGAGVIQGDEGADTVRPEDEIIREETAAIFARALGVEPADSGAETFDDADDISDWAFEIICGMVNAGIIVGDADSNTFRAGDSITRAEVVSIMDKAVALYVNEPGEYEGGTYDGYVIVTVGGVTFKDVTIDGNLIIGESVGDGEITLEDCEITGETIVNGGQVIEIDTEAPTDTPTETPGTGPTPSEAPDTSSSPSPTPSDDPDITPSPTPPVEPTLSVEDIARIQAYTDETMYGTGVVEVEVTYRSGVDLSGVTADSYILEDRGTLTPDFGEIAIERASVDGRVVTLTILNDTAATENNDILSRERNAFGIYTTGSWYRGADGTIYYGSGDTDAYEANTTGLGYQARESLELKLRHSGEAEDAAACLADENGRYDSTGLWAETIDRQFGEGKFQSFAELGIEVESTAKDALDGTADEFVRGYAYIPETYDPENGIVFTLQGQGISYWILNEEDGTYTDNEGTGIMYDSATTSWAENNPDVIVVNIHDRSSAGGGGDGYDHVIDDVNVMKYFIDTYEITGPIVLQGNSRGTFASSNVIKGLAGVEYAVNSAMSGTPKATLDKTVYDFTIDVFICNNGSFFQGTGISTTEEEWAAIAATGLRAWIFDGEQDSNNITPYATYQQALVDAGYDESYVRLTGYASELYAYWGESDHSTTRINGWYFDEAAYYGPDLEIIDGEIVYNTKKADGETYTLLCRGSAGGTNKAGYAYVIYDDLYQQWALTPVQPKDGDTTQATPFADVLDQVVQREEPNRLPLTGYYSNTVGDDRRELKVYIGQEAPIRTYFTVIAIPDGVEDTYAFLEEAGWIAYADEMGEGLFVLEPKDGVWGDFEAETGYVADAMAFLLSPYVNGTNVFSTFGLHYFVGYGEGAPALEAWIADNPLYVIAQAHVGSRGLTDEYLDTIRAKAAYVGDEAGYTPIEVPEGMEITRDEVVMPSLYITEQAASLEDSLNYWMYANDVGQAVTNGDTTVYPQKIDSNRWMTEYWNRVYASLGETTGISKVTVTTVSDETDYAAYTGDILDFMTEYTRYENANAYSNQVTPRADYGELDIELRNVELENYNYAKDREYLIYVPEQCRDEDAPLLFVSPGGSQTDRVFLDATQWWYLAQEEGFVLVIVCEGYTSPTTVSYVDSDVFVEAVLDDVLDNYSIDETRIYLTGQSMGSAQSQYLGFYSPAKYAAVASTSMAVTPVDGNNWHSSYYSHDLSYESIPVYYMHGEGDGAADAYGPWGSENVGNMTQYHLDNWGLEMGDERTASNEFYTYTDSSDENPYHGYQTRTWSIETEGVEVPVYQVTRTLNRAHNCYTAEMVELWGYLKQFRVVDQGDGTYIRYYSQSGFTEDDAVAIYDSGDRAAVQAVPFGDVLDQVVPQEEPNRLPLTGYFTQEIGGGRTVKVYIADGAPVRSYFTVIAVPDGVDTYAFLEEAGWIAYADERSEGLFILEPGTGGWGGYGDEQDYVSGALSFLISPTVNGTSVFSTFGEHYFVGYGDGAPALEAWVADNPLYVIAQAYVDSPGLTESYFADIRAKEAYTGDVPGYTSAVIPDGMEITRDEVVVPALYITADAAEIGASLGYWSYANDVDRTEHLGSTKIYHQKIDSTRWMTEYWNSMLEDYGLSKVVVTETAIDSYGSFTAQVADFVTEYTRYENAFAYSNVLGPRADYAELGIQLRTVALEEYTSSQRREYLLYVPEGVEAADEAVPLMLVMPGGSQTDQVFLDATQWWAVARQESFILAIICEDYSGATSVTYRDTDVFVDVVLDELLDEYSIDESRIYLSGQSAGSDATQSMGIAIPQRFAAVASTSGAPFMDTLESTGQFAGSYHTDYGFSGEPIPVYFMYGEGDIAAMAAGIWGNGSSINGFSRYHLENWDLELGEESDGLYSYSTTVSESVYHGAETWTWSLETGGVSVPVHQITETKLRGHNCYASEMWDLWEYARQFSVEDNGDGTYTRYYSPSGFTEDDAVSIYDSEAEAAVEQVTAITDSVMVGQKLKAVAIAYQDIVDPDSLTLDSYEIEDLCGDNRTLAKANITNIYTNSEAAMTADGSSVEGRYVIIEIDESDGVGTMVLDTFYYTDTDGNEDRSTTYIIRDAVDPQIRQLKDIGLAGGETVPGDEATVLTADQVVNLLVDDFGDMVVPSDSATYPEIYVKYYLPEGYDSGESYPMVVVQCGGGLRYKEIETADGLAHNYGANIMFDTSATAWMDDAFKANPDYDDMIVVSVHNRGIEDSAEYNAADDINRVVEHFIENYKVDADRIYYSGNSQGSLIGYETVAKRPDLWAAFMPCNGLSEGRVERMVEFLDPMAENYVAVMWQLGRYDAGASAETGQYYYDYMVDYYTGIGLSGEEIDALVRFNVYEEEDFLELGILNADGSANFHGATKLVYTKYRDAFMPWILGQSKANRPIDGTTVAASDAIVGITPITDSVKAGQKLMAVAVEYDGQVNENKLDTDTYAVRDLYADGLTVAEANVTAVYTNDRAEMRGDKTGVAGSYVIIELDENDGVGRLILDNLYYTDPDGETASVAYGKRDDVSPTVQQLTEIRYANGRTVTADGAGLEATEPTVNLLLDEFEDLILTQEELPGATHEKTYIKYYLPEGYDGTVEYPMIMIGCGSGLRFHEVETVDGTINNFGANIMFDTSATAWMDDDYRANPDYDDMIVVSLHYWAEHEGTEELPEVSATDVNLVANYFVEHFAVDTDRVYYSGNSYGTVTGFIAIGREPDLWTAFMACNALPMGDHEDLSYLDVLDEQLIPAMDAGVAFLLQIGQYDNTAGNEEKADFVVDYMTNYYREQLNMDDEEIEQVLAYNVYTQEDFIRWDVLTANGEVNYHSVTKLVYTGYRDEFMPWMLGQTKAEA